MGGRRGDTHTTDVHTLNNGEWTRIGSMSTVRTFPIVVIVSEDKMAVVGSWLPHLLLLLLSRTIVLLADVIMYTTCMYCGLLTSTTLQIRVFVIVVSSHSYSILVMFFR